MLCVRLFQSVRWVNQKMKCASLHFSVKPRLHTRAFITNGIIRGRVGQHDLQFDPEDLHPVQGGDRGLGRRPGGELGVAVVLPPDDPHVGQNPEPAEDILQCVLGRRLGVADEEHSPVEVRAEGVSSLPGGDGSDGGEGAHGGPHGGAHRRVLAGVMVEGFGRGTRGPVVHTGRVLCVLHYQF